MVCKFRALLTLLFTSALALLASCEFNPHEVPMTELEKPADEGPPVIVSLNDKNDTVKIGWTTDFHYDVRGTSNRINYVTIIFEGQEIHHYSINDDQGFNFTFDPSGYNNGDYHLVIKIYTTTGSGSIADKIGDEAYLYELNWPVHIDKTLPEYGNSFLKADHSSNGIELLWNSFDHPNFISYIVCRYYPFIQSTPVPIATITDPLVNTFTDSTFWEGQDARYFIRTVTPAGFSEGQDIVVFNELKGLKATWHPDGTADVTWDKAENLESFGKYYVYSGYRSTDIIEEYFVENPDQNLVRLKKAGFGSGLEIFLKFIPQGINSDYYRYLKSTSFTLFPPPVIPSFYYGLNVNNHDFLLLSGTYNVYRYFPDALKAEDSISVNLDPYWLISVSNNGNQFVYYQNGRFFVRRTEDFALVNEFPGPPLSSLGRTMQRCSLADNGNMLAVDNEGYAYLFNSMNGTLIREDSMNIGGYPMKTACISPDGKRIAFYMNNGSSVLYTLDPSGWTEKGRTNLLLYNVFFSKDGTRLYLNGYSRMEIRDAATFSLISGYELPGGYYQAVDLDNERLFYVTDREFEHRIADLNSGSVLTTLILGNSWCRLFGNYLVSSGLQLTLPEF